MKSVFLLIFTSCLAFCQTVPTSPDTVVATIDGRKLTWGELSGYLNTLTPDMQRAALQNRTDLVHQYALLEKLFKMAEQEKIDQRSPYKEQLASERMQLLAQAEMQEQIGRIAIDPAEIRGYYDAHRDDFAQVKLKAIYIAFVSSPPAAKDKKYRTETEASAKIEELRKQIANGADFGKLAKENSDDQKSREQNGDFGVVRKTDQLPESIRAVVFQLKTGEVSSPLKQRNGFYLFRAEEAGVRTYDQAQEEVQQRLKQAHFKQFMDQLTGTITIKPQDPSFFTPSASGTH